MKKFLTMVLAMTMMGTTAYAAEEREKVTAIPKWQEVAFDGHEVVMPCYNIDGYTYLRLRDYAEKVTEYIRYTQHRFNVEYDDEAKCINIDRVSNYIPVAGVDSYVIGVNAKEAIASDAGISVNGSNIPNSYYKGYVIDGYTFYKLRDLNDLTAGLDIEWCEEDKVIELTSEPFGFTVDEDGGVFRKPVIYLYPEETTDISVELEYDGDVTVTYPAYNEGWKVTAEPDGTLTNHADGREYSYLFWEGEGYNEMDFSEGFVVKGEDTVSFLQDKLSEMGMTPREYNEFIVYWLPYLQDNAYNLISFQWENYEESAKLNITPEPDNMLRVFMAFKAIEEPVEVPEQKLPVLEREGFTVVEWGGTEVH